MLACGVGLVLVEFGGSQVEFIEGVSVLLGNGLVEVLLAFRVLSLVEEGLAPVEVALLASSA